MSANPSHSQTDSANGAAESVSAASNGANAQEAQEPQPKRLKVEEESNPSSNQKNRTSSAHPNPDKAALAYARAQEHRLKNKRKAYNTSVEKKGGEEPITHDIVALLGADRVKALEEQGKEWDQRFQEGDLLEVTIARLSAHGDGLGVVRSRTGNLETRAEGEDTWVMAVPRALPGETVKVEVTENDRMFSRAVVIEHTGDFRAPIRKDDLMLEYEEQMRIKQSVVENAFRLYSGLESERIPAVLPTMPSPAQYDYRTKLTPHFELPAVVKEVMQPKRKYRGGPLSQGARNAIKAKAEALELTPEQLSQRDAQLKIGFHKAGKGHVIDIEECVIATPTLNKAMAIERQRVKDTIFSYPNGATLLLRDSLERFDDQGDGPVAEGLPGSAAAGSDGTVCVTVTDHKKVVLERVNQIKFESPAGTFFQNNRSILSDLIGYVREAVDTFWGTARTVDAVDSKPNRYLVDAYCGSGLFSLCLADAFDQVSGVEISADSIRFAERNAELNGLGKDKVQFLAGKAEEIFGRITYPPEQTTLIIDPPRKGCDDAFIQQLIALGPALVVYVSCNVHTQARDVGQILRSDPSYKISSIRGADLFPQTHHVEGVCVLVKN
ncbi:tRNA(m5U54)methyltransferase [Tilletia horrida]|nr:tRNA(m5U54)methyltransferase [Tilletia horrida]